jgi:hypothetical protein
VPFEFFNEHQIVYTLWSKFPFMTSAIDEISLGRNLDIKEKM